MSLAEFARPQLVVIPCGAKKLPARAPAGRLYCGSYFRSCQAAAVALDPLLGYLILSALHGFLRPDTMVEPYEMRMGKPGSVDVDRLRQQAVELGLDGAGSTQLNPVVALGGRSYVSMVRKVWPPAIAPVAGPLGAQRSQLRHIAERGRL